MFTKYIHKLGVSPLWSLSDVFGLEPEHLEWIPKPVKAVILLCPCSDSVCFYQIFIIPKNIVEKNFNNLTLKFNFCVQFEQYSKEQDAANANANPSPPKDLFFLKQYIHNACGAIALVHGIANSPE